MCHEREVPTWMETNWILGKFSQNRKEAITEFINFVREDIGLPAIWSGIKKQIYLGSEQFVSDMLDDIAKNNLEIEEIPKLQRRAMAKTLTEYQNESINRDEAIRTDFSSGRVHIR